MRGDRWHRIFKGYTQVQERKKSLFNKIFSLWVSLVLFVQQVLELDWQHVEGLWVGWEAVAASLCFCAGTA